MRPDIEVLLEEFERLSLDERVYLDFVNDEDLAVRVRFQKCVNGRCWSIWYIQSEDASRQTISRSYFPRVLRAFSVSNTQFERELGGLLLTQVAYADEFIRQVSLLCGDEAVRKSILQTQQFMDSLREAIPHAQAAMLSDKNIDSDFVLSQQRKNSTEQTRSRFRIIKNSE